MRSTLLNFKMLKNKVLLYSKGNYIRYPVTNHNEKEYTYIQLHIFSYICVYIYM